MRGAPLDILSDKYFTKHRVLSEDLENPYKVGFEENRLVWCRIDVESKMTKRNESGARMYHVWAISDTLKQVTLVTLDQAAKFLSNPLKTGKDEIRPDAATLNKLLSKIDKESSRLIQIREHQAVTIQNLKQAKSKSGFAIYKFTSSGSLKLKDGKKVFKLAEGDLFKVHHRAANDNVLKIKGSADKYIISDLQLSMLICRSSI
jgi:uncharacterized protein (DUF2147 family)